VYRFALTPEHAGTIRADRGWRPRRMNHRSEHFGLSIPQAPRDAERARSNGARLGRAADAPLAPVGSAGLRDLIAQLTDQGLSKFVVRSVGPITSWPDELDWLAGTLLDLQT
jgi:hypothetical protein